MELEIYEFYSKNWLLLLTSSEKEYLFLHIQRLLLFKNCIMQVGYKDIMVYPILLTYILQSGKAKLAAI